MMSESENDNFAMNKLIIQQFKLLIKQIKLDVDRTTGEEQMIHMFRLRSIQGVLKILEKFPNEIKSADQFKGIKGVGKRSLSRIDEIIKTGKLSEVKITDLDEQYIRYLDELEDVFGIGRKKAYELFTTHGVRSVAELKERYEKGEIKLPDNIAKGLSYVGRIVERIPREESDQVANFLCKTTIEIDPQLFGIVCGSYRRLVPTSNDIDFILIHPDIISKSSKKSNQKNYLQIFVVLLKEKGFIIDSLTAEDVQTKYMGIFQWNQGPLRRIDIRLIPYDAYYPAILYFTGPGDFNRKMRQVAINSGYMLNEYGLYDENNKPLPITSEKDIFDHLGMEYLSPEQRF